MGVPMPFPLKNPDACTDSGLTCPLNKDVDYAYVQTLQVLKVYPKVGNFSIRNFPLVMYFMTTFSITTKNSQHFQGDCRCQMGTDGCCSKQNYYLRINPGQNWIKQRMECQSMSDTLFGARWFQCQLRSIIQFTHIHEFCSFIKNILYLQIKQSHCY